MVSHGIELGIPGADRTALHHRALPAPMPMDSSALAAVLSYVQAEAAAGRMLGPLSPQQASDRWPRWTASPVFTRPKTSGGFRIICDLSWPADGTSVNDRCADPVTVIKHDTIAAILAHANVGDHALVVDVRAAYRLLPIHPSDVPFLGMRMPDGSLYFDAAAPFGLRASPAAFFSVTSLIRAIIEGAARSCIPDANPRVYAYVDDFIIISKALDRTEADMLKAAVRLHLVHAGAFPADNKWQTGQKVTYLGASIDFHRGIVSLTPEKLEKRRAALASLRAQATAATSSRLRLPRTTFRSVVGTLGQYAALTPGASIPLRVWRTAAAAQTSRHVFLPVSQTLRVITALEQLYELAPHVSLARPAHRYTVVTDASPSGFGAYLVTGHPTSVPFVEPAPASWLAMSLSDWTDSEQRLARTTSEQTSVSTGWRELAAIGHALATFAPYLPPHSHVCWLSDSTSATQAATVWSSSSSRMRNLLLNTFAFAARHHIVLVPKHTPADTIPHADALSRPRTYPDITQQLRRFAPVVAAVRLEPLLQQEPERCDA